MEDVHVAENADAEIVARSRSSTTQEFREEIPDIVDQLVGSCQPRGLLRPRGPGTHPFPGRRDRHPPPDLPPPLPRLFHPQTRWTRINLGYYFGQEAEAFFEVLSQQIALAIRHECLRHDLSCTHCEERGQEDAIRFMQELPTLRKALAKDVRAAYEGDPAAKSYDEIIFSYPGLFAVTVYRIAHRAAAPWTCP